MSLRLVSRLKAVRVAEATEAVVTIAVTILDTFEDEKRARALLDYDDLIAKARALLTTSAMAPWVLYKLDGGIDHILVDEAQDTSPEQWDVVARIADEFLSGHGAREVVRTIFAVGDEKQSIFSFQGADPTRFDDMKRYFEKQVKGAERRWDYVPLTRSFRSVPEVLRTVDRVFELERARNGLTASGDVDPHIAHRDLDAGLVEIWDLEEPDEERRLIPGMRRSTMSRARRPCRASPPASRKPFAAGSTTKKNSPQKAAPFVRAISLSSCAAAMPLSARWCGT